jgi:hypothetical protein
MTINISREEEEPGDLKGGKDNPQREDGSMTYALK